jgi:hypothetical protein
VEEIHVEKCLVRAMQIVDTGNVAAGKNR